MKKISYILLFLTLLFQSGRAQVNFDSLKHVTDTMSSVYRKIESYYYGSTGMVLSNSEIESVNQIFLELGKSSGKEKDLVRAYFRRGWVYYNQNKPDLSLKEFFQSLSLAEKINDSLLIADNNREIADIYIGMSNPDFAKKHLYIALKFLDKERKKHRRVLNNVYQSLTTIYKDKGVIDSALKYANMRVQSNLTDGNKSQIAASYNTLALVYKKGKKLQEAKLYLEKTLALYRELNNNSGIAGALINLGNVHQNMKDYKKAVEYATEGIKFAAEAGNFNYYKNGFSSLSESYYELKDFENSAKAYRRFVDLKDSLNQQEVDKQIAELTAQYETSKKDAEISLQQEQIKSKEFDNARQKVLIIASCIALLASVIAILFIYRSFKQNKRNARQLAFKNQVIEEKNREITDSINYARLIQQSLLASKEMLSKNLKDYFILYKPKDIVSGDFYWASETKDGFMLACVDCTGHGVPGAFMSLIGKENLDKASGMYSDPGRMLSELNRGVKRSLNQEVTGSRDGMDAGLIRIEKSDSSTKVFFAGANRPMYVVRRGNSQLEEFKPTKSAIGGLTTNDQVFESVSVQLSAGDMVYLCSDGYADQFGSDRNKKMTTKRFKEILTKISIEETMAQKENLETYFNEWKGKNEQLDDILVIGVRV